MIQHLPVIGICGYSGSGKTTLIEKLIHHYSGRGFRVAVIKHDVHGLVVDKEGKDSDRLFKAGADVMMRGVDQFFSRSHKTDVDLYDLVTRCAPSYDLIFLEGHKSTPYFDKIWLEKEAGDRPEHTSKIKMVLARDEDRFARVLTFLETWLPATLSLTPVYGGIISMTGAMSEVSRSDVASLLEQLETRLATIFILGNSAYLPLADLLTIPPAPAKTTCQGAMLAARRWAPLTNWLFFSLDDLLQGTAGLMDKLEDPPQLIAPRYSAAATPYLLDFRAELRFN